MAGDLEVSVQGRLGVLTLARPQALNALTEAMVHALTIQLCDWRMDPAIGAVLIKAVPGRAFCAGGDIRHVADAVKAGHIEEITPFFAAEYRMNWRIKHYPKPYIALIDGIVMGGGVGVSVHGSHRLVTDNALFAMPETGIGMFPDVGGTYFLPRLPGHLGFLLGLTGRRLRGAECVAAGVATDWVAADRLDALVAALAAVTDDDYEGVIDAFRQPLGEAGSLEWPAADAFGESDAAAIAARLQSEDPELAAELASKSPLAVCVALEQLRRGGELDFADCMRLEFGLVHRLLQRPDFVEGVRALIVDKDKAPRWSHAAVADVSPQEVVACFEPVTPALSFDWQGV